MNKRADGAKEEIVFDKIKNLKIEKIVIHEVYRRNENKNMVPPLYGTKFTKLDKSGLETLQLRIVDALGHSSHSLEMDIIKTDISSMFHLVNEMLKVQDKEFINLSQKTADKLTESQGGRNIPGGILVLFKGTVDGDNKKCIGIIKAETHAGFKKLLSDKDELMIEFINDLLLTPSQKMYKIGLFVEIKKIKEGETPGANNFKVIVFDHNMTAKETRNAALYFYEKFLGCSISATDKKVTQDFYYSTKEFIDKANLKDEDKIDLNYALYTYLKTGNQNTISVDDFATKYFSEFDLVDKYKDTMTLHSFPGRSFVRDIEYIKNKLKWRAMKFTSNVKIIAPSEKFTQIVQFESFDEEKNESTVKIKGRIQEQE